MNRNAEAPQTVRSVPCPLCGERSKTVLGPYPNPGSRFLSAESLAACNSCSAVFADPLPDDEALARYYETGGYYGDRTPFSRDFRSFAYRLAQTRIDLIRTHTDMDRIRSVLDVGAGNGAFGLAVRQSAPRATYEAVEPDETCRKMWGDWVFRSYRCLADVSGGPYSLVVLNQVLEHMPRPVSFIRDIGRHMNDGGLLFIDVPYRDDLYKPSVEPHLLFWDRRSLQGAAARAGYGVLFCDSVGMKRNRVKSFFGGGPRWRRFSDPWVWMNKLNTVLRRLGSRRQIDMFPRFQASVYGGNRQWIRCIVQKGRRTKEGPTTEGAD